MIKGRRLAKKGFTLVELSFAIAFISILLITITLIINEIVSIYRKGYSIKTVNQIGRSLIDDLQDSLNQSPPSDIASFCALKYQGNDTQNNYCKNDGGFRSIYQQYYAKATINGSDSTSAKYLPVSGLFCTGRYTYIWNTGYILNKDGEYSFTNNAVGLTVEYPDPANPSEKKQNSTFRLLKVEDNSFTNSICAQMINEAYGDNTKVSSPPSNAIKLTEEPEELLTDSDNALALYDLVIFKPARANSGRLFYSGSFILGTLIGGVNIMSSSNYCQVPEGYNAIDFSYCAINKFNFSMQVSGENN